MELNLVITDLRKDPECLNWLSSVLCRSDKEKDAFLKLAHDDTDCLAIALDNPELFRCLHSVPKSKTGALMGTYIGVRHRLKQNTVFCRQTADYVSAVCNHYLLSDHLKPGSPLFTPTAYVKYLRSQAGMAEEEGDTQKSCTIHTVLGNYILFVSGALYNMIGFLEKTGGFSLRQYENIGANSYKQVASHAEQADLFRNLGENFPKIRKALSTFAKEDMSRIAAPEMKRSPQTGRMPAETHLEAGDGPEPPPKGD